jgi:hypothetical protein
MLALVLIVDTLTELRQLSLGNTPLTGAGCCA